MEGTPKGNEEEGVNLTRRGFLKGLTGVAVVGAVGAGLEACAPDEKKVAPEHEHVGAPYDTPIDALGKQELMNEIVHDVSRVQMLEQLRDHGQMSGDTTLLEYFFARFSSSVPSRSDFDAEIAILEKRITDLRNHRDRKDPL